MDVEADENYGCGKDITSDEASTVTIYSSKSRSVASCNDPFNGSEVVGTDWNDEETINCSDDASSCDATESSTDQWSNQ